MSISPYDLPKIYEIAFSFRDYPLAVDFLIDACKLQGMEGITSMVELGCGPGQYCREFAKRGINSTGVDISPEMIDYVNVKAKASEFACRGVVDDYRSFKLSSKVDLGVCMMTTFEHLLTNQDALDHLDAVADCLAENGIYVVELSHPRDLLTAKSSVRTEWTMEQDNIAVTTNWGAEGSQIDPLTEISQTRVTYDVLQDGETKRIESYTETRPYTAGLMRALIKLSGRFKIAAMYGDLDINQPFDDSEKSWRMILVLRKFE